MPHEDDTPLTDEELALAKKGEALVAAAVADTQAPRSLRESIERDRERAGEPTLAEVQQASAKEATGPAPAPGGGDPPVLAARVGPISFPDWQKSFGWRAVGARKDEISGRTVKTVYYRNPGGAHLGYSIVAGAPIAEPPPGHTVTHEGNTYHVAHAGEHTLVTWTQQGHTCTFVASSSVPDSHLVELAASRNT